MKPKIKRALIGVFTIFLVLGSLIFIDLGPYFKYCNQLRRIDELPVEPDTTKVPALFEAHGFEVIHKTTNTGVEFVEAQLVDRTPLTILLLRLIGIEVEFSETLVLDVRTP